MPLAASLLFVSGLALESYALPEARVVAELPSQPELVSAGPSADVPQSVAGYSWRSQGSGIQITVSYDKWKTAHFAPEIALDRLARQTYGRLEGFTIAESEVGGLEGALMTIDAPQGAAVAVWNVKSGVESWQITVKPTDGFLSPSLLEDLRDGLRIDARPEPEGLYDQWGQIAAPAISSRPIPSPLHWESGSYAGLHLDTPVALEAFQADRKSGETAILDGLREWHGAAGDVEIFLSTFTVKENLGVDLEAWGETFGPMLERDGLQNWQPAASTFPLGKANTRNLKGLVLHHGQTWNVQIFLAVQGRQAWALQVRTRDTAEGRDAMTKIGETLTLSP